MRRNLNLLRVHIRRFLLVWMAFRGFALTLVVQGSVPPLVGLAVWSTAVRGTKQIPEYFFALLLTGLAGASYERYTFSERIYNGEFTDDLLRPQPVILETVAQNLALRIWHLGIGLPIIIAVAFLARVNLKPSNVFLAVPALLLAGAIAFLVAHLVALSAFWTHRVDAVMGVTWTIAILIGGGAVPIPLLPDPFRAWAEVLPFRAMQGFPAEIASGWLDQSQTLAGYQWQLVWFTVLLVANLGVWRAGLRRYTSVGG